MVLTLSLLQVRERRELLEIVFRFLFGLSLIFAPLVVRARCLARRNFATSLSASRRWLTQKRTSRSASIRWCGPQHRHERRCHSPRNVNRHGQRARRWLHHVYGRGHRLPRRSRRRHREVDSHHQDSAAPLHWTAQSAGSRQKLPRRSSEQLRHGRDALQYAARRSAPVPDTHLGSPRAATPRAQPEKHSPAPTMTCASDSTTEPLWIAWTPFPRPLVPPIVDPHAGNQARIKRERLLFRLTLATGHTRPDGLGRSDANVHVCVCRGAGRPFRALRTDVRGSSRGEGHRRGGITEGR